MSVSPKPSLALLSKVLATSLLWLTVSFEVGAVEIFVTPGAVQDNSNNGDCSIVDAIRAAEADVPVDTCPAGNGVDRIKLGGAVYRMTTVADYRFGYNATPCISSHIIIEGEGAVVTRNTAEKFRLFCIDTAGHLELENISVTNGSASGPSLTYQRGGGILARGELDIRNSELSGNTADQHGGALFLDGGTAVVTSTTLRNNSATKGGAIRIDSGATIALSGSVLTGNLADYGGATFFNNSTANVVNTQVTANNATRMGGGLYYSGSNGSVTSSNVSRNTTVEKGGGIRIDNFSTVSILKTAIDRNTSSDYGGGGIYVIKSNLDIKQSTISNNVSGRGAGLYVDVSHTTLENCTLSGNRAANFGGGIYVDADESLALYNASATLKSVSIISNTARGGAGIWLNPITKSTMSNSLIAANSIKDCTVSGSARLINQGGNWFGDSYCSGAGRGDPKLGPLKDNGGPTQTHAVLPGSPVIDSGILSGCPNVDQRGKRRPNGVSCDAGAFEYFDAASSGSALNGAIYLLL